MFLTESLVKHPPTPRVLESDLGIIILIIKSGGDSNTPGVGGCWTDRAQHCQPILSQVGPPRSPPALHHMLCHPSRSGPGQLSQTPTPNTHATSTDSTLACCSCAALAFRAVSTAPDSSRCKEPSFFQTR